MAEAFLPFALYTVMFTDLIRSIIDHFVTQLDANNPNLELTKAPLLILQSQSQHDTMQYLIVCRGFWVARVKTKTKSRIKRIERHALQGYSEREHAIQVTIMH